MFELYKTTEKINSVNKSIVILMNIQSKKGNSNLMSSWVCACLLISKIASVVLMNIVSKENSNAKKESRIVAI